MRARFALALAGLLLSAGTGAGQTASTVYYWPGLEEFVFHLLPVGGWNVLGAASPRSMAMGETLLSERGPAAGYLQPALLGTMDSPRASVGFRLTENRYRTYQDFIPLSPIYARPETKTFERTTTFLDQAGVVVPIGAWVFAANYTLFQEFNMPDARAGIGWDGFPGTVRQSGDLKGIHLSAARRFGPSFTMGCSASYVSGRISRDQISPPYYYVLRTPAEGGRPVLVPIQTLIALPTITEDHELDLRGMLFNLGIIFEPGDAWRFGLMLRPPGRIRIEADLRAVYTGGVQTPDVAIAEEYFMKQPLVAVVSGSYRPLRGVEIAADLGYWGWGDFSSDFRPSSYYYYLGKSIVKLNLGLSWAIPFRSGRDDGLELRAGYSYDPQPYEYGERFSRNFAGAGVGASFGRFSLEAAAKLAVSAPELQRFMSNQFKIGAGFGW